VREPLLRRPAATVALFVMLGLLGACSKSNVRPAGVDESRVNSALNESAVDRHTLKPSETPIVLSLSGGGVRAASMGIGVMLALDSIKLATAESSNRSMLQNVVGISSVSGGGLAPALYMSLMFRNGAEDCAKTRFDSFFDALMDDGRSDDARLALLRKSWHTATTYSLLPAACGKDVTAANLFEHRYIREMTKSRCGPNEYLTLADVQGRESPFIHVPNATLSQSGRIFAFTDKRLNDLEISHYLDASRSEWVALAAHSRAQGLPYSVALAASAAFPPTVHDTRLKSVRPSSQPGADETTAYVHLTDGGQSDDNGYQTAVRIVEDLANANPDRPIIYLAMDALPDPGWVYSEQNQPEPRRNLFMRNHDLPRYGNKRELPDRIYGDPSQKQKTALDDVKGRVFAGHIALSNFGSVEPRGTMECFLDRFATGFEVEFRLDAEAARVGTVCAGLRGLREDEQASAIYAGMIQTYRALLPPSRTTGESEIASRAQAVAKCVVLGASGHCADSSRAWKDLESAVDRGLDSDPGKMTRRHASLREPDCADGRACLVEFSRHAKLSDWSRYVDGSLKAVREYEVDLDASMQKAGSKLDLAAEAVRAAIIGEEQKARNADLLDALSKDGELGKALEAHMASQSEDLARAEDIANLSLEVKKLFESIVSAASEPVYASDFDCPCDAPGECRRGGDDFSIIVDTPTWSDCRAVDRFKHPPPEPSDSNLTNQAFDWKRRALAVVNSLADVILRLSDFLGHKKNVIEQAKLRPVLACAYLKWWDAVEESARQSNVALIVPSAAAKRIGSLRDDVGRVQLCATHEFDLRTQEQNFVVSVSKIIDDLTTAEGKIGKRSQCMSQTIGLIDDWSARRATAQFDKRESTNRQVGVWVEEVAVCGNLLRALLDDTEQTAESREVEDCIGLFEASARLSSSHAGDSCCSDDAACASSPDLPALRQMAAAAISDENCNGDGAVKALEEMTCETHEKFMQLAEAITVQEAAAPSPVRMRLVSQCYQQRSTGGLRELTSWGLLRESKDDACRSLLSAESAEALTILPSVSP
jgi:hypothetical protein